MHWRNPAFGSKLSAWPVRRFEHLRGALCPVSWGRSFLVPKSSKNGNKKEPGEKPVSNPAAFGTGMLTFLKNKKK